MRFILPALFLGGVAFAIWYAIKLARGAPAQEGTLPAGQRDARAPRAVVAAWLEANGVDARKRRGDVWEDDDFAEWIVVRGGRKEVNVPSALGYSAQALDREYTGRIARHAAMLAERDAWTRSELALTAEELARLDFMSAAHDVARRKLGQPSTFYDDWRQLAALAARGEVRRLTDPLPVYRVGAR